MHNIPQPQDPWSEDTLALPGGRPAAPRANAGQPSGGEAAGTTSKGPGSHGAFDAGSSGAGGAGGGTLVEALLLLADPAPDEADQADQADSTDKASPAPTLTGKPLAPRARTPRTSRTYHTFQTTPTRHPRGRILRRRRASRRASFLALILVVGFVLTCAVPLIPLLALGYDAVDAAHRAVTLDHLISGGAQALLSPSGLAEAQDNVNAMQRDLQALSGASNVLGGPIGAISGSARDYQLLIQVSSEVTTAAAEGLNVAQTVVQPLQGSALGADTSSSGSSGITMADLNRATAELNDAEAHIALASATAKQIDFSKLPSQLGPNSSLGHLLTRLPEAQSALEQLRPVLAAAPQLLGVTAPAYYLLVAMDPTELRPAGGLMGNYGLLVLDHGKQSKQYPLSLQDVYPLDHAYYTNSELNTNPNAKDTPACMSSGPQVPMTYWWWPIRDFSCDYGWGLRDSGLSPDFPTNAQVAENIVTASGMLPQGANIQGVIAFTPAVIENILRATGSLSIPEYNVTVTADTLESLIHQHQLTDMAPKAGDRKTFTHDLSIALLARVRSLHGSALKPVVKAIQQAVQQKEVEIYFSDPQVEAVLGKMNLTAGLNFGTGDGFSVVDTNDGGNKANTFVTEQQTDLVTLLPDGGALHLLQIQVTYDKRGSVYQGSTGFEDYSDVQRTYLPEASQILGYAGFDPPIFYPAGCGRGGYTTPISACAPEYALTGVSTASDTPGANMVLGAILVPCGVSGNLYAYRSNIDYTQCDTQPTKHTATIYIAWYTPNAVTFQNGMHGTYTEHVYKQPGSRDALAVYLSTVALGAVAPDAQALADRVVGPDLSPAERDAAFAALLAQGHRVTSTPLTQDMTIQAGF